jgi:effector-binding domain-containing protein
MKKLLLALIPLAILFLIVSFFIPMKLTRQIAVANTWQNVETTLQPQNLSKWSPAEKNLHITQVSYLLYQLEGTKDDHTDVFGLMITPNAGKAETQAGIVYSRITNLFYKLFPFLEKPSFATTITTELKSYLEDNRRFYGFSIELKAATDTLFVTKRQDLPAAALFTALPGMQQELEAYAKQNNCRILAKNMSFTALGHDSLSVMVGLNIDKIIAGDYIYNFRQLPGRAALATGYYTGPFRNRTAVYQAMEKYLKDHQLAKRALPYETYSSPFPEADTSTIQIALSYPVAAQ